MDTIYLAKGRTYGTINPSAQARAQVQHMVQSSYSHIVKTQTLVTCKCDIKLSQLCLNLNSPLSRQFIM